MSTRIYLRLESVSGIFSKKSIIASDCIQPWAICRQRSSSSRFFQPVHLNWLCQLRDAVQLDLGKVGRPELEIASTLRLITETLQQKNLKKLLEVGQPQHKY